MEGKTYLPPEPPDLYTNIGGPIPVCVNCVHYLGDNHCEAFRIIPDGILKNGESHDKPLPDQENNLTFKKR